MGVYFQLRRGFTYWSFIRILVGPLDGMVGKKNELMSNRFKLRYASEIVFGVEDSDVLSEEEPIESAKEGKKDK